MTSRPDFHRAGPDTIKATPAPGQRIAKSGLEQPLVPFAFACPVGPRAEARVVLEAAIELESDLAEEVAWYLLVPIAEFGQLTAGELVAQGRAETVLAFLRAVIEGRRG